MAAAGAAAPAWLGKEWRASIFARVFESGRLMKQWILMLFVWWRGATWGTLLATLLYGQSVGADEFGNRYYQNKTGRRRWVLYNGTVEASRVPPDWHGWLHFTFREPPTLAPLTPRSWEKPYIPNLTGTLAA